MSGIKALGCCFKNSFKKSCLGKKSDYFCIPLLENNISESKFFEVVMDKKSLKKVKINF